MDRLTEGALAALPQEVRRPRYDRRTHGAGVVHLGVGAFHRAHQAVYVEDAIEAAGGDWMIDGVALRRPDAAAALEPQDGLYALIERRPDGPRARVVGSLRRVLTAPEDPAGVLEALVSPGTRIVTLTVTEKGYGLDPTTGGLAAGRPDVAADLAAPDAPTTAVGWIVRALGVRRAAGLSPFTPVSCDNLPGNGAVLRRLVVEYASRIDEALATWIEREAPFPSTMVDRITPASTPETYAEAARLLGVEDRAAVEAEPFSQWVIEDRFAAGRPALDAAGAQLVADVGPFEAAKLRMLNGAHSLMAYCGALAGLAHVRDAMADEVLAALVARHLETAARTLRPAPGLDPEAYSGALLERFANPAIAHRTLQIATDGSHKLPPRWAAPAREALAAGLPWDVYAFGFAAWIQFLHGHDEAGEALPLDDPLAPALRAAVSRGGGAPAAAAREAMGLRQVFPHDLAENEAFAEAVGVHLERIASVGVRQAARALLAA